jgi:hypothetical protein
MCRTPPPISMTVWSPIGRSAARTPNPAIILGIEPFAVQIQFVDARQDIRYIKRTLIAFCSREEFLVTLIVPSIPTILLLDRSALKCARIIALHHSPLSLLDDDRVYLLIID